MPETAAETELRHRAAALQNRIEEMQHALVEADTRYYLLRSEVDQRKRGAALMAELREAFDPRNGALAALDAALDRFVSAMAMDAGVVYVPSGPDRFVPAVTFGYAGDGATPAEVTLPASITREHKALLLNAASVPGPSESALRTASGLPFLVAAPIIMTDLPIAVVIAGRFREQRPASPRLNDGDLETLQALSALVSTRLLRDSHRESEGERVRLQAQVVEEHQTAIGDLERLTTAYARFVPKPFLEHLGKSTILEVSLGNQVQREMTIFFSDIRDFTSLSEGMNPQQNFNFLNSYLERAGPVIREHHGFIDKYIGDAIMALFPDRPIDAVNAAIALQQMIVVYNGHRANCGYAPVRVGVGLHVGRMMLGTIGEHERMETTVISDAVNFASRLEGMNKMLTTSILISGSVSEKIGHAIPEIRPLGKFLVKGKTASVAVSEVYAAEAPVTRAHKRTTAANFAQAIQQYHDGQIREALPTFAQLVTVCPDDGPAKYYLRRCHERLQHGDFHVGDERLDVK